MTNKRMVEMDINTDYFPYTKMAMISFSELTRSRKIGKVKKVIKQDGQRKSRSAEFV